MENNFDSMLNVSAVPQDDKKAAFIAKSKNNRNRCYELSEQITNEVAQTAGNFSSIWTYRPGLTAIPPIMPC